jgi:hypothetical protein
MARAKPAAPSGGWPGSPDAGARSDPGLITKVAGKCTRDVASAALDLSEPYGLDVKRGGMPEEPRSDGVASVSGAIAAELAAAGFEERHAEVVATVGNTVYCIGGANRPTHEGPVATVDALDFK